MPGIDLKKLRDWAVDVGVPLILAYLAGTGQYTEHVRQVAERLREWKNVFQARIGLLLQHDITAIARDMHGAFLKILSVIIVIATVIMLLATGFCGGWAGAHVPLWFRFTPLGGFALLARGAYQVILDMEIRPIPFDLCAHRGPVGKPWAQLTADEQIRERASLGTRTDADIDTPALRADADIDADPLLTQAQKDAEKANNVVLRAERDREKASNRRLLAEIEQRTDIHPLLSNADLDAALRAIGADRAVNASPLPHFRALLTEPALLTVYLAILGVVFGSEYSFSATGVNLVFPMLIVVCAFAAFTVFHLGFAVVVLGGSSGLARLTTGTARPINTFMHAVAAIPPGITFDNAAQLVGQWTGDFMVEFKAFVEVQSRRPLNSAALALLCVMIAPQYYVAFIAIVLGIVIAVVYGNLQTEGIDITERRKVGATRFEMFAFTALAVVLVGILLFAASRSMVIGIVIHAIAVVNSVLHIGLPEGSVGGTATRVLHFLWGLVVVGVCVLAWRSQSVPAWARKGFGIAAIVLGAIFILNASRQGAFQVDYRGMERVLACGLPPATRPIFDTNDAQAHQHASSSSASVTPPTPPRVIVRDVYYRSPASGASASDHQGRRHSSRGSARATSTRVVVDSSASSAHGLVCCRCIARELRADMLAGGSCSNARDCERPRDGFCD